MGHVFFPDPQSRTAVSGPFTAFRRLVVATITVVAGFALYAGVANAAVPGSDSINQSSPTSTSWMGMPYAAAFVSEPTLCPPQFGPFPSDPGNGICDHFQLTTQDSGPVTVLITWTDPMNTFYLLVCLNNPPFAPDTNDDCVGGTVVAEDLNNSGMNFDQVSFNAQRGVTYEVRSVPFFVIADMADGCAGYTNFNNCAAPSSGGGPPTTSSTCPGNPLTDNLERKINGGGDIADGSGNMKEHLSFKVARDLDKSNPLKGKINYKNDGTLQFKSKEIDCVTYTDEGTDANGNPKGSAEFRGSGKLKLDNGTTVNNECFRAFGRDNGEPGGSQDGGSDQFDIAFVAPQLDGSCVFMGPPVPRTITKGNIDYHLNA